MHGDAMLKAFQPQQASQHRLIKSIDSPQLHHRKLSKNQLRSLSPMYRSIAIACGLQYMANVAV
jgi:hypothetical protein